MTTITKNAPDTSGNSVEGNDHNIPAGDLMNKEDLTVLTVDRATDIDWNELPKDVEVHVPCTIPGCKNYQGEHVWSWGDSFHHCAFEYWADIQAQVSVDYYEDETGDVNSLEANTWSVNGFLADDDKPLTVDRVTTWMSNYNSAVCLAAELNGEAR
ncbi:hypothetical protein Q7F20_07545 [Curtobacterium sp. A7_M15]|uniref:hypothetical protein n=1 Tax=Curtobacterium sp. A7_M15 TaxID=3065241 RepID=UPI00273782BD|nr:hypothetical protein [Curtobacterium sp. A7_M15]MDP4333222.1 hypothetical protein [Curtobacterium sp. A7_M15]